MKQYGFMRCLWGRVAALALTICCISPVAADLTWEPDWWRPPDSSSAVPANAIDGQDEGGQWYKICRAPWPGDTRMIIPGKLFGIECYISFDDHVAKIPYGSSVEVLICKSGYCNFSNPRVALDEMQDPTKVKFWRRYDPAQNPGINESLVVAGTDHAGWQGHENPEYVCSVRRPNGFFGALGLAYQWHPGKLVNGVCYFPYGDDEHNSQADHLEFLVLTTRTDVPQAEKPRGPIPSTLGNTKAFCASRCVSDDGRRSCLLGETGCPLLGSLCRCTNPDGFTGTRQP